jgi:glycosyltransferase involved in cell wall biosynthesis
VHFLGDQPLETVAQWMNAASLLCLPSYMEGVPNVVLEAFSCGTKVIATSVGGIPELDARQGNIRLIDPRSVSQLTQALSDMRSEKYLYVESNFINTWHENAARIFQIFQKTGGS